ncbi:MAG: polyphosphate:AMP phosphotransferase [Betaproteobacteria bacterium RIFCSPLOWO2_02_FULL_62_17]|nr:MAG: polyphosphate:AMP phosphotransferase [Betaproteobacteria bacterium RIFCSPLOWO2_02_FULL_62_17]
MFESAEVGHKVEKAVYAKEEPKLREALLNAQFDLSQNGKFATLILIGGVDGAGKGETVNLLNEWMDPRHIRTVAYGEPSDEERERPMMWRFWRSLPPRGEIGVVFGSWYTAPIVDRVIGKSNDIQLGNAIDRILHFERMLSDEGVLILKFWFHLSKKAQKKRLEEIESNPRTRWRVTKLDWERFKIYDKFSRISAHTLRETSTANAPWTVVEGSDPRYRSLTVGKILLGAMRKRLTEKTIPKDRVAAPLAPVMDNLQLLRSLDLKQKLDKKTYDKRLEKYQGELNLASRNKKFRNRSLILLFEGSDAAGKGGAIRRITGALDARQYTVIPVAAPTSEERVQPYLWRFWRHVPRLGRVTIFDRTWYGRVLVERVEKFCAEEDWMRAYSEINDFEEQLVEGGAIICKFWLQISADEQLKRFKLREKTSFKRFKITEEDWRNRKKWTDYEAAVADLVDRTSTEIAPWTLVEAEDKLFGRLKVVKTVADRLAKEL